MSLMLYSRIARIGGPDLSPGCGYRDIVIHEMTEGEIRNLKTGRVLFPIATGMVGFVAGVCFAFWQVQF